MEGFTFTKKKNLGTVTPKEIEVHSLVLLRRSTSKSPV